MDPRLGRAVIGLASLAALAGAGDLARARQPDQTGPGPPPAVPPSVLEQQTTAPPAPPPPASVNTVVPSPNPAGPVGPPPDVGPPPPPLEALPAPKRPSPPPEAKAAPPPAPPPGPPPPIRSPTAVLQVLDKVTAETLKFEAPVGRRIRYKTLVFTVRVCETRGADDPQPRPSAYVVIDSEAPALPGRAPPPAKEVYKGWMFADGPGLHPLEHPIYDAWLVACSTAAPAR